VQPVFLHRPKLNGYGCTWSNSILSLTFDRLGQDTPVKHPDNANAVDCGSILPGANQQNASPSLSVSGDARTSVNRDGIQQYTVIY